MFFYAYVLLSQKDNNYYIGYTNNLKRRLEEHNSGKNF
jgi:putative endonuclease